MAVAPIFVCKGKGCSKGDTATVMFMGVLADAILNEQLSTKLVA